MKTLRRTTLATAAALVLAACGGSSSGSSAGGGGTTPTGAQLTRGAVTAKASGSITVNGVQLSTSGVSAVRVDDNPSGGLDDVKLGDVVRVRGTFDDRTGAATEIEVEHGIEGRVEDKGIDFIQIAGQRIQVDDTAHFDDRLAAGIDAVGIGSVVMVSGVPVAPSGTDDKGGLRASRIDLSPRNGGSSADDQAVDVKGFVSALDTGARTFQLRATPDAARHHDVSYASATLPVGVANGSYVEVRTATAPTLPGAGAPAGLIASITASSIRLEDALSGSDVEVEGYVTSLSGSSFVVNGVTVHTDGATRYLLGTAGDLVVGAKVEAEGSVDAAGVLHATKVAFRPGTRITAIVENYTGTAMTLLGVPVQVPAWARKDLAVVNGVKVEVRGNPTADGLGVVADRITSPSGGSASRVFIRALVTAKGPERLTVLGFAVNTAGASLKNSGGTAATDRTAWFGAVEAGRTVVKVRANDHTTDVDTGAKTWIADEVELEGNDG